MRGWLRSPAVCGVLLILILVCHSLPGRGTGFSPDRISSTDKPSARAGLSSDNGSFASLQNTDGAPSAFDLTHPEGVAAYCEVLSRGKQQAEALKSVCEFALSLRWKLPNVICDEERKQYQEGQLGDVVQKNIITAKVRYEDGEEQYSQITVNGKAAQSTLASSPGIWSEGEFATGLRTLFLPQSATEFKFTKQDVLHSAQVLVFEFRVERKNNSLWYLKAPLVTPTFPGYRGRLWVNISNLHLVRLERKVMDVETDFPIQQVSTLIDYHDVALADGTNFVLPMRAADVTCPTVASSDCWHNEVMFKHWQKFAAKARILTGEEKSSAPPATIPPPDLTSLPMMDRDPALAAEFLVSTVTIAIEPQPEKTTVAAVARIESARIPPNSNPPLQTPVSAEPATNGPAQMHGDELPIFRSSVRLVLVPTVVRDSQRRAVDYLQKTDFRLLDDRRPQVITQFSLERPGVYAVAPPEAGGGAPQEAPPVANRYAAYVFDDIHASLSDLVNARDAAKRHLTSLRQGDLAAIFTLSGDIATDFTHDPSKLAEALQHIQPHPVPGTLSTGCPDISYAQADLIQNHNDAVALEQATEQAVQCAYAGDSAPRGKARRLAEDTAARVLLTGRTGSQASFNTLRGVVRWISHMPGQRSVVLVSPGFPMAEMQQELDEITDDALRAEVIINVVDPSGLSTVDPTEFGSAATPSDVLVDLTGGTGGAFFRNRNNVDEGFRQTTFPDVLYILGFSPQKLDGKLHRLKVTVQRNQKLSLQARRAYYAAKATN